MSGQCSIGNLGHFAVSPLTNCAKSACRAASIALAATLAEKMEESVGAGLQIER
jgi:hypothetical protein